MALFCANRLANKQLFATISRIPSILNSAQYGQAAAGSPKIDYKPFVDTAVEHYDDKNERLKRPMSPHLTIYAPQLTTMLSITHRISGMLLSGYAAVFGIGAVLLPYDMSDCVVIIESLNLSPTCLFLAKAIIAAPFGFHFANGIRHLYWDTGKGLSLKEVYTSGYTMLAIASVLTLALAAL